MIGRLLASRGRNLTRREALECYLFISPVCIGLLAFTIGPILASLYFSFTEYNIIRAPKWVGLGKFHDLIQDELFWQSLKVTSLYVVMHLPLSLVLALGIALLMNQKVRGIIFFRTVYYLPSVVSGVAVALLWMWIFNPEFGILNTLLALVNIQGPAWLFDEHWSLPAIALMSLWGVGGSMLIYLAGLQGIPSELYEAAEIDGASRWRRFWFITLPLLSTVILFNLVMGLIASFQEFTPAYVMTSGGPNFSTLFYNYYLYENAFEYLYMGYASAMAWVLLVIVLILTLLVFKSSPMWVFYQERQKE
ncbi:MAG: sugar ABC transporter permease [Caldilineaceae bacterium]|nr:sugar ABC transporter permease [Caldilineaceae bacterium]